MSTETWRTFEHPHRAYRLEFPGHWEHRVEKEGIDCGFGPADHDDVGLWISITPVRLDADRLHDAMPLMFQQAIESTEARDVREDSSLQHHAMKADRSEEGEGGHFWMVAGGDLVLFASSQVPSDQRDTWNPLFERVMASLEIHREDQELQTQISTEVIERLKAQDSDQSFMIDGEGIKSERYRVYLGNVCREIRAFPDRKEAILDAFVAGILNTKQPNLGEEAWLEILTDVLPVLKPRDYLHDDGPTQHVTYSEWLDEIVICYVINTTSSFRFITSWDLERWEIDQDALHEQAIENLAALPWPDQLQASEQPGVGRTILVHTADSFDASRLLHPELHMLFSQLLGSPFLAAIPDRDTFVTFTDEPSIRDEIGQTVNKDHAESPYPISARLFLVTPDGIALA